MSSTFKTTTVTAYKNGTKITLTEPHSVSSVNCGFYQEPQVGWSGITVYIKIRDTDYDEIDTIKGKTYIAPTSGSATISVKYEGTDYNVTIPVFVNVKKYLNSFSVTQQEFKSEYQEFVTDTNNTLTSYYSYIQQNAENISLKVSKNDLLGTGIDIENQKITITADNLIARNNYGEQTMRLDANGGMVLSSGAVINGWVFNPPVRLNMDNLRRYCILEHSNNPTYSDVYCIDLEKLGQYLIVDEFNPYIENRAVQVPSITPVTRPTSSYINGIEGGVINETANVCDAFQCVLTATPFQSLSSEQLHNQSLGYMIGFTQTGDIKDYNTSDSDYTTEYVSPLFLPSFSYNGNVYHYKCYSLTKDEQITDIRKYINKSIKIVNNSDTDFGINGCLTVVSPSGQQSSGVSTVVPAHSARHCEAKLRYKPRTISGVSYLCEEMYWEISQVWPQSDGRIRLQN